jgi:hypothetical protein
LYHDEVLAVFGGRADGLLAGRFQRARGPGSLPQLLDGAHYVLLLSQERVAQIAHPSDVLIETSQHVREHHQRLHTGIPRLFGHRVGQFLALQMGMLLEPAAGFDDFEGVRRCDQRLA